MVVGDRDQRRFGKLFIERHQIWDVQTAMQGRDVGRRLAAKKRQMKITDVKMNNVEIIVFVENLIELNIMIRLGLFDAGIEP